MAPQEARRPAPRWGGTQKGIGGKIFPRPQKPAVVYCRKGGIFVYFLIDYENVQNSGMRGSEYLLSSDHVIVFYSKNAPLMEMRHLDNIKNSGCGFEVCELLTKRKNGLDFYIATKVGELFGAERCKNAVLISNDSGFQAIRDYWQERSGTKHRVALSESIEHGIITAGETSERANLIRARRKAMDIGQFYVTYQEHRKFQQILQKAFMGTTYSDRLQEIQDVLETGRSPKVIYLDSLRRFGRKDGQEIYRRLKACRGL